MALCKACYGKAVVAGVPCGDCHGGLVHCCEGDRTQDSDEEDDDLDAMWRDEGVGG